MTPSLLNQFSIDGTRKLCKISMYKCALIVAIIIAISLGHLNDIQPHIMNDLVNVLSSGSNLSS